MNKKIIGGAIGGIVGGLIVGVLLQNMGVMLRIASLAGDSTLITGWIVHIIVAAVMGVIFALVFGKLVTGYISGASYGLLYGFIWWILGALIAMPVLLGKGVQFSSAFDKLHLMALMGHLIFGIILGLVYIFYITRGRKLEDNVEPKSDQV